MGRNKYGFEKRQRELSKERKKEEKRQRKLDRKSPEQAPESEGPGLEGTAELPADPEEA